MLDIPGLLGGFVMSFSFVAFVIAMSNTTVANVVFIISTQTMFLAIFGYFYLKEKVSLIGSNINFFSYEWNYYNGWRLNFNRIFIWKYSCISNSN